MMRIGHGYDVHRFAAGRRLVLGGVEIPYEEGLLGHSDADALCHALADALFGAVCLPDIGRHFPDNDPQYEGANSLELLRRCYDEVLGTGFALVNADCTIVAERPKLAPHVPAMRENIAETLGIPVSCVSVKATTSERMNDEGAEKCMTARAVCTLLRGV